MSSRSEPQIDLPSFGVGDGLPFYTMGETPFEKLSRALIREEPDVKGGGKYGTRGQKQYGIDVYGELTNGQGIIVGQSKAYEEFDEDDLDKVAEDFFEEIDFWKDEEVKKFILLVGSEIERTQVADKQREVRKLFEDEGIEFEIWDAIEIEKRIGKAENCQHFVKTYIPEYTNVYTDRICYKKASKHNLEREEHEKPDGYIERTVSEDKIDKEELFFLGSSLKESDLANVLLDEKRILLLGGAGLGKTYEVERVAHKINGSESPYYPKIISLKNYTDKNIDDYLNENEQKYKDNIALLFDGLDEMPAGNRAKFIKKLNEYCKDENSLVLVSCRENLFEKGRGKAPQTLEGFQQFYLNELTHDQIEHYVEENVKNKEEFFSQIYDLGINNLLKNPFYLVNIVSSYREDGSLPANKSKVFDFIFDLRLKKDIEKIRSKGSELGSELGEDEISEVIKNANLKLALTLEVLGKNICDQNELVEILDEQALELIKFFSSIVNEEENGISTWQFEHRQLQEFFAAQGLKNLSIEDLIEVIAFPPRYQVLKPGWYNTIGLLVSIIDKEGDFYQKLIDWLLENELEVFLYLEKDKISEGVANEILSRFIKIAQDRDIGINLTYQELYKLSNLITYESTRKILINHLEGSWENINLISDLITLASETKFYLPDSKEKIVQIFQDNLFNEDHPSLIKRSLIRAISKQSRSKDLIESIINEFRNTEDKSLKATLFRIIEERSLQSEYSEFLIESLEESCEEEQEIRSQLSTGTRNVDIPIALSSVLSSIDDLNTFLMLAERFIGLPREIELLTGSFVDKFVEKAVILHREDKEAIESVMIRLYVACCENYTLNQGRALLPFFEKTNIKEEAFTQIIRNEKLRERTSPLHLISFYTRNVESLVIDLFDKGEIEEKFVQRLLNSGRGSDEISELREKLQELQKGDFSEPQIPNWEEIRSERRERDLQVIFYKEKFLEEVEKLFSTIQDDVTPKNIRNISIDPELAREFSDLVVFEISNLLEQRDLTEDEIKEEIYSWDWDYFRNHKFYQKYIRGNRDPEEVLKLLEEEEVNLIRDWCFEKMEEINFREALDTKENGLSSTSYDALFVWVFQRVFEFDYPEEKLKEMMSYEYLESYNYGLNYYEKYFTSDIILEEVFRNLDRGIEDQMVIKNHLEYAVKKGASEVLVYTIKILGDNSFEASIRKHAVDSSLELDDGVKVLIEYLVKGNIDDVYWYVVDKIISSNTQIDDLRQLLVSVIKDGGRTAKINAAARLILLQDTTGLQHYVDVAKEKKRIPSHKFIQDIGYTESPVREFRNPEGINQLLELLELEYHEDFAQPDYRRLSQSVKIALKEIALHNEENFKKIISNLEVFIQEKKEEIPNVKFLYNFIDDIGKQFYLNKSQKMDLESAIKKSEEILHQ